MSETTQAAAKVVMLKDTNPMFLEMNRAVARAIYLEKGSDHIGAAKEYNKASEIAMALSEHYKAAGQLIIGAIDRSDWVMMKGYKNKAGVYAGKAREAEAASKLRT